MACTGLKVEDRARQPFAASVFIGLRALRREFAQRMGNIGNANGLAKTEYRVRIVNIW
jgi:hypothetical protein